MNSSRKENIYFNTISNIPMFENGHKTNRTSYKTTYNQEYMKKNRYLDNPSLFKSEDFSIYNKSGINDSFKSDSLNKFSDSHSDFIDYSQNSLVKSSYISNPYKTKQIPSFIKRDNFYQSNAEKNIKYLHTHTGGLIPIIPSNEEKTNSARIDNIQNKSFARFYNDKYSETQSSYLPKIPNVSKAKILPHLRDDKTFHTNSEKNISFIKTSTGELITYVPHKDDGLSYNIIQHKLAPPKQPPYENNHFRVKLNNKFDSKSNENMFY